MLLLMYARHFRACETLNVVYYLNCLFWKKNL